MSEQEPRTEHSNGAVRAVRRALVFLVGGTVLIVGVLMIVLPGPATVVIPLGLAILATEFLWAARLLERLKAKGVKLAEQVKGSRTSAATPDVNDRK